MTELYNAIRTGMEGMEGWCDLGKALYLANLILKTKPEIVVELGVFGGKSIIPMGLALRQNGHGVAYGVDPWSVDATVEGEIEANVNWWNKVDIEKIGVQAIAKIRSLKLEPWIVPIHARSEYTIRLFPQIDLLHIDGNHSEVASTRDVKNYLPMLRNDGFLVFDDCDWTTTKHAVGIIEEQCELVEDHKTWRTYQRKYHP